MTFKTHAAALALLIALAPAAQAQEAGAGNEAAGSEAETATETTTETEAQNPTETLPMGEEVPDPERVGTSYKVEDHGDWELRCVVAPPGQQDPCNLYQLLRDRNGNDVAEISLFPLPEGSEAAAGATIITPLETLLTEQVTLSVDGGGARRYPFTFCGQIGCFSRIGLRAEEVESFKRGAKATLTIVPLAAPDQKVTLDISLSGFTAGYAAVGEANQPKPE